MIATAIDGNIASVINIKSYRWIALADCNLTVDESVLQTKLMRTHLGTSEFLLSLRILLVSVPTMQL